MRIHTLLYILLVCPAVLNAQSGGYELSKYRYWFDGELVPHTANYTNTIDIDASSLDEGFHTLHYQVVTTDDVASPVRSSAFYRISPFGESISDYTIETVRYWFDGEKAPRTSAYTVGTAEFDAATLDEGFHTLHYQVVTTDGVASPVRSTAFYRISPFGESISDYTIETVRYWFDGEKAPRTSAYTVGTAEFDAATLDEGFHTLHYQVVTTDGVASPVRSTAFYRISPFGESISDYTIETIRYWFDGERVPCTAAYTAGTAKFDVAALDEGFHTLHYQVVTDKGMASPVRTVSFFRFMGSLDSDYAVKTVRYWIDGDTDNVRIVAFKPGLTTLEKMDLGEGEHTLTYQVVTDDGQVSPACTVIIEPWLYDIYVSRFTEYNTGTIASEPLFSQTPDLRLHYDINDPNVRGQLTVDAGTTLRLGKYVQAANWGNSDGNDKFAKAGENFFHPTTLVNNGIVEADSVIVEQSLFRDRWHFISLPFNADVADISGPETTCWTVRTYDGAARAAGQMGNTWTTLRSGDQMEAGRGYIVQLTNEGEAQTATLTFKASNDGQKDGIFAASDVSILLESHTAELLQNRDWNLVGNPYPSFYDTHGINLSSPVIVWNGSGYTAYSLYDDDYVLMPFEAFFVQKPIGTDVLTFDKEGRQHTVVGNASERYNTRQSADGTLGSVPHDRTILNFAVVADLQSDATEYKDLQSATSKDRTRIVINEQACMNYEQDKDAPKFLPTNPQSPQLMTIESGVQYAINERPMGDGLITFSVYAPEDGEYRFSLVGNVFGHYSDMTVLDTETGEVWALANGDYVLMARAGMNHARLVVSLTGDTSGIEQVCAYDDGEMQIGNGHLSLRFARPKQIKVFGIDGRQLYSDTSASASFSLRSGIYIVDINGKTNKIMVK